jgi:hypothetical protein
MRPGFLVVLILISISASVFGQKKKTADPPKTGYTFVDLAGDTILYREKAAITLRNLKNGSVIVRLKTNEKSIEAYKNSGRGDIAEKIAEDRKAQNLKLYDAFTKAFTFCKVFFIYAKDTRQFLDGKKGLFLDRNLNYDPSIKLTDANFVFCEFGSAESYSKFTDQSSYAVDKPSIAGGNYTGPEPHEMMDTISRRTSTTPATTSGLFFSDKDLRQFQRPFPFTDAVYLNNPYPTVHSLSREMERVYMRLVTSNDFRIKFKEEKKKMKQQPKTEQKKTKWIDY